MQTKDQPQRGRPPDYSAEIADTICDGRADGESLKARPSQIVSAISAL